MASRLLFLPAAALFASAAFAQQPDEDSLPEKSADQIRCELAGDCLELDLAPTEDAFDPPPPDIAPPAALRSAAPAAATRSAATPRAPAAPRMAVGTERQPGTSALTITFVRDSAAFTSSGRLQAGRVFEAIHTPQFDGKRFQIAGHTDATGASAANLALSRKRAQALADYLVSAGIDRARLDVVGFGAARPLPGVPARSSANRRVEISVID